MQKVRVYVLADQAIYRASLRQTLGTVSAQTVVGDSGSIAAGLSDVRRLRPDVVLLDVHPSEGPVDCFRVVRAVSPSSRVVLLTEDATEAQIEVALEVGFGGVVSKDASAAELTRAIETVCQGLLYVSSSLCPEYQRRSKPRSGSDRGVEAARGTTH
jgi:DNA-binding NarL/FixJ family response regulator